MPTLTFKTDRFIWQGDYSTKDLPKLAGFRWNPETRSWWTTDAEKAKKLVKYGDLLATAQISAQVADQQRSLVQSRATGADADVNIPCPPGLQYLPYQRAGIAYASKRRNTLIADDMGLGKTIQAIGVANSDPGCRSVLVICPAVVKLNWQREWTKWTTKQQTVGVAFGDNFPSTDVVVINYDIVARHRAAIDKRSWDLLICDESHNLKNSKAQRTRAILGGGKGESRVQPIQASRRLLLTGTPILNRPSELWTTVQALDPQGLGGNFFRFHQRYCNAHQTRFGWDFSGAANLDELQTKLRQSIMVRRLKSEVLTELPAKRRQVIELPQNGAADVVAAEKARYEALEAELEALRADVALAQAADDEAAYRASVARLNAAVAVAFSEMSRLRHATAVAKIPAAIAYLHDAIEASGKVVCFAHHLDVIHALQAEFGDEAVSVTGQTAVTQRQAAVDRFQTDPSCKLFLGNIQAAGVGITLTAAAHVILVELDWRPPYVTQAEDRCHRIGQRNSVLVQHLVFDGSLDALMAKKIVAKQEIIEQAMDGGGGQVAADDDSALEAAIATLEAREAAPPAGTPAEARKPSSDVPGPTLSLSEIAAVRTGLTILAGLDPDHAAEQNGVGFNRFDGRVGHALAAAPGLSQKQAVLGRKILRKYVRQLGRDLIEAMGV